MTGVVRRGPRRGTPGMRIAVTIIAGGLTLVIALQPCTDRIRGGLAGNERLHAAGDAGWLIVLLYLIGAGFSYGAPALAVAVFGTAGLISLGIASASGAGAFGFWGVVAWVLAALSLAGWLEQRRVRRRRLIHRVIDEEFVPMARAEPLRAAPSRACPRCGTPAAPTARFCERCGQALTMPPAA
jgi:zinc-ribbon domain